MVAFMQFKGRGCGAVLVGSGRGCVVAALLVVLMWAGAGRAQEAASGQHSTALDNWADDNRDAAIESNPKLDDRLRSSLLAEVNAAADDVIAEMTQQRMEMKDVKEQLRKLQQKGK